MLDVGRRSRRRASGSSGAIYETPCAYSQTLSELSGARCFVKLENLQMTGSFKERGAANLLLQLDPAERARGVVAGQRRQPRPGRRLPRGAARDRRRHRDARWAPLIKVTSARRHGAEVILHGANYDEAYDHAREIAAERGLAFVHPFDDARVDRRPGHARARAPRAAARTSTRSSSPVGGGGLVAGVALAIKARRPEVRVIGVQAEALPSMQRALEAGARARCRRRRRSPTASRSARWASSRSRWPRATSTTW